MTPLSSIVEVQRAECECGWVGDDWQDWNRAYRDLTEHRATHTEKDAE